MKRKISVICLIWFLSSVTLFALPEGFEKEHTVAYGKDTLHTYTHPQTGLQVVWVENKDKNASFMLGVRTPTSDSTGVNHIIEHSVFTGSQKFPVPNLFFDASSKYPHVFMNAMTSADLTMYPFATPYATCYERLLEVYLDSIFKPDMLVQENSFFEESFHYNPTTNAYGGVVYNEMKGAAKDVNRVLYQSVRKAMYGNAHYANDSGGDPNVLPGLTYEQFVETYKKYYYPGNMLVVLYGDLNIDKTLTTLGSYLQDASGKKEPIDVNVRPAPVYSQVTFPYDSVEDKAFIVKSFQLKEPLATEEMVDLQIWMNTYLMKDRSYFKTRLQQMGIYKVDMMVDDHLKYPIFSLVIGDVPVDEVERYQGLVDKVLQELSYMDFRQEKIEMDTIRELQLSTAQLESDSVRGVEIGQSMLDAWAHEKSMDQYFKEQEYVKTLTSINGACRDKLLGAIYQTDVVLLPQRAEEYKDPLSISKINKASWASIVESMETWQNQKREGVLEEIALEDLVVDFDVPYEKHTKNDVDYVLVPMEGNIVFSDLYIPTAHVSQEDLPYLFLYRQLLSQAAHEYTPYLGDLLAESTTVAKGKEYVPYLHIAMGSLAGDIAPVELYETMKYSLQQQGDQWFLQKLLLLQRGMKMQLEEDVLGTLMSLSKGGLSGALRYEYEGGYPFYAFCTQLVQAGDTGWIEKVKQIGEKIDLVPGTMVSMVGDKKTIKEEQGKWQQYQKDSAKIATKPVKYKFEDYGAKSYYQTQGEVDYLLYTYQKPSRAVSGEDYVAASYITKSYLQPNIRIKRGAYGSSMIASYPNKMMIYTYRDPDYIRSLEIIDQIGEIEKDAVSADDLYTAQAGAISSIHKQFGLTEGNLVKAMQLQRLLLQGEKVSIVKNLQREVLEMSQKDLQKYISNIPNNLKYACLAIGTREEKQQPNEGTKIYSTY